MSHNSNLGKVDLNMKHDTVEGQQEERKKQRIALPQPPTTTTTITQNLSHETINPILYQQKSYIEPFMNQNITQLQTQKIQSLDTQPLERQSLESQPIQRQSIEREKEEEEDEETDEETTQEDKKGRYNIKKKSMGLKPTRMEKKYLAETIEKYCGTGDRENKRLAITECLNNMNNLPQEQKSRQWDYHKVRKYVNNHTLRREEFSVQFQANNKVLSEKEVNQIVKKRKRSISAKIPDDVKKHILNIKDDKTKINTWLRENYYYYSNKELAKVLNVQPSTIVKRARRSEKINVSVITHNICCARSCVSHMTPQQISQHFNAIWSESNETTRRRRVIGMLRDFKQNCNSLPCIRFCKQVFLISHQMRTRCINEDKSSKMQLHSQMNRLIAFSTTTSNAPLLNMTNDNYLTLEQQQAQQQQQQQQQQQAAQQQAQQQAQQLQALQQAQLQKVQQLQQQLQHKVDTQQKINLTPRSNQTTQNQHLQNHQYHPSQLTNHSQLTNPSQLTNLSSVILNPSYHYQNENRYINHYNMQPFQPQVVSNELMQFQLMNSSGTSTLNNSNTNKNSLLGNSPSNSSTPPR